MPTVLNRYFLLFFMVF